MKVCLYVIIRVLKAVTMGPHQHDENTDECKVLLVSLRKNILQRIMESWPDNK